MIIIVSFLTSVQFINEKHLWLFLNHTWRTSFGTPTSSVAISYWLFLSRKTPFNLPPFGGYFIKKLIPKRECFVFGITSSKVYKTRAYVFHVEESNIATVVAISRGRDIFFLNAELFGVVSIMKIFHQK